MKPFLVYSNNADYLRLVALNRLASGYHREDIISGGLAGWILAQYRKARLNLANISETPAYLQYAQPKSPLRDILITLVHELPTLYLTAKALFRPQDLTVSSFAVFQSYKANLDQTFYMLLLDISRALEFASYIKQLYDIEKIQNKVTDGDEPYPNSTHSAENGMAFELKDVSFAYAHTNSKDNAIRNVSLKIEAGQLVVIVGDNGSGKSTLIKLLTRLYDVDSGEILVDGLPIKSYRLSDIRQVQAVLTQDHQLFPLSLAENIGLGSTENLHDMEMIRQAAEDGGAADVIEKMTDGIETTLSPATTAESQYLDKERHKDLQEFYDGLENSTDVSGGERQRLVTSRTFMRFLGGGIRFAVADEPSSAMDPKAEHRLFQRFRESRQGKTLVFVTHRFGHLVKHADLIVRMKDGQVAELGTHSELMARGGEYSESYNVQAQAYADGQ
ncbi:P-loop containing nucleoside triphosphate hydrolase protein [Roridomyces roridus]|uniref:P-loop containing nucleoside triphosphate hydrolase protein n=1 Tax=Roridomyces roridus TaxID=1738132 RepID=A0AAD7BQG0_9AGAR|nr:P-loop containing nucleoside triphosphate hydrolase protein [Roridomyces roridus]